MEEIWRSIADYEGLYEVSDLGNIRGLPRVVNRRGHPMTVAGKPIRPKVNRRGYLYVNIYRGGKQRTEYVHRFVAAAFVPNPDGKPEVNHKDNDPGNPRADNLEWVTHAENQAHAAAQVRLRGKLSAEEISHIRTIWPTLRYGERSALAERLGVTTSQIWKIGTGRAHRHVPHES